MKRKLLILSVLVICVATLAAGTLAYFNAEDTAHNVITSGGVGIQLIEKTKSGDTLVDFPEDGLSGILPGTSASKIVSVENTGSADAWIRVKVEMTITGSDGEALPLECGDRGFSWIRFTELIAAGDGDQAAQLLRDGLTLFQEKL